LITASNDSVITLNTNKGEDETRELIEVEPQESNLSDKASALT